MRPTSTLTGRNDLEDADDVKPRLVKSIQRAPGPVFRLITGHRGSGKTTELNRVAQRLSEGSGDGPRFVSMMSATRWLDTENVTAEEIVFQMVRQLVADLTAAGFDPARAALGGWWKRFKDRRAGFEVSGFELGVDPLTVSFTRAELPADRERLRDALSGQLPTLFDLVNDDVLRRAAKWLALRGLSGVVLVVDELDRIPQKVLHDSGLTNHEVLFLDNAGR